MRVEHLTPAHLDAAAALLAARQRTLRVSHPELPAALEVPDAHRPLLEALLGEPGSHHRLLRHVDERAAWATGAKD